MKNRALVWLVAGAVLLFASQLRWGVGALAWIAPIPWLRYLRGTSGWRSRVAFGVVVMVTWIATTAKIVTAPLPAAFALLGVAFGAIQIVGYLAASWLRRRTGDAVLVFPAVMVVLEWLQHTFTGLASWAAAGYTQVDDLPLLQLASVGGLAAISFVVYLFAAAAERALAVPSRATLRGLATAVAVVAAAHAYGAGRLAHDAPGTVRVAAIGTIATFDGQTAVTAAERAHLIDTLLADTAAAARAGARVAVWTEAAALVEADEEGDVIERIAATARASRIDVVAAYIVPRGERFENKLAWLRPDGTTALTYWKHHPAPGEPAIVGTDALQAIDTDAGRWGAALCYDYDFPALAAAHGALDVNLVALPSSDWRGIDPIHTQMAAVRAVEQGVSIVRATRFGLSAGIDPHGRIRAWSSSFDTAERVLVVDLPRRGVDTPYRHVGDLLVYASLLGLALATAGRYSSSAWNRWRKP